MSYQIEAGLIHKNVRITQIPLQFRHLKKKFLLKLDNVGFTTRL